MWIDDKILEKCPRPKYVDVWRPESVFVVCGRSNEPQLEVNLDQCDKDNIPVLKRYGGGGTVVLHPGCLVISLGMWVDSYYDNAEFFHFLNAAVIDSLSEFHPVFSGLSQDGLSDIVFQDKKIAGTSLFRSRNYLLYQASILVEDRLTLIEKYLKHPSKEPDYRAGRSHSDFITCLSAIEASANMDSSFACISNNYHVHLDRRFGDRKRDAFASQIPHILAKIDRG